MAHHLWIEMGGLACSMTMDEMKPARGIWISVALGIPAWIVVLVVLYLVLR
jgi:hypothetical protein